MMRIGVKLLISLVVIALVPLLVVSRLERRATARLGDTLASQIRETLADDAKLQLQQLVDDAGMLLRRDRELVEQALQIQAREVEEALAAPGAPAAPGGAAVSGAESRAYFAEDFDFGGSLPLDLVLSPTHFVEPGTAEATPMPVSYAHAVFKLAPGVSAEAVAGDIARLSSVVPTYRFLVGEHPELFYWNYTSLQSGVHCAYPGHGGYPSGYDPRERDWYTLARGADGPVWTRPMVDASSRRLIMTAAMAVKRPDGSFAGVTAIDVPLSHLLAQVKLPAEWAREVQVMLVARRIDPDSGAPEGLILAQQSYGKRARLWKVPIRLEKVESDDKPALRGMLEKMGRRESGVEQMVYGGRRSLWAYGRVHEADTYLVVVAPYDVIVAEGVNAEEYVLGLTLRQLEVTSIVLTAVIVLVILVAIVISGRITNPLRQIVQAAKRVAAGDFGARVEVASHDELGEMGRAFNAMVPELQDSMRMRQSLALANQVQRNLLPQKAPEIDGLDVAGRSMFCDETGGDYYDFLTLSQIGPRSLGVAVGDVTGHGISAALLMATARALLRSHAIHPGNLGRIMADINAHMAADTPVEQFTTLFYAVIDAEARSVRWANAGHDPAIVYDPATGAFDELDGAGIPLGIEAGFEYEELRRNSLKPGQLVVIGTDGIWETRNGDGQMFGKDKLRELIRRHAAESAEAIATAITESLAAYRGSGPQEDDVTLVVIKVT